MVAYLATFHGRTRNVLSVRHGRDASVEIAVPEGTEPLEHIAREIARELDLMRFEVEIGDEGGYIRLLGDDGPGIAFSLAPIDTKDD